MKVGIIGYGNMGQAIAERLKSKYSVLVFDKDKSKTGLLKEIEVTSDAKELVNKADVVILAVKPQDFNSLLGEIKNCTKGKLVISIAAGISTRHIEKILAGSRVIRAMPNIGLKIAKSVTCLSKGASAADEDLSFARELFDYLGVTKDIDEGLMNAATAISGSGPGYIFYFMEVHFIDPVSITAQMRNDIVEHLKKAAQGVGFSPEEAESLAVDTSGSSIGLATITKIPLAELKKQVASKGGTTEAGLKILEKGGSWSDAAQAALRRAEELSLKE